MKKTILIILTLCLFGGMMVSCGNGSVEKDNSSVSIPVVQDKNPTSIPVYGFEDRFIGAWETEQDEVVAYLFLSNGKYVKRHVDTYSREWESWGDGEWYTDSGNILCLGDIQVYEYRFIDQNTVEIIQDDKTFKLTRITEHFAGYAYGDQQGYEGYTPNYG